MASTPAAVSGTLIRKTEPHQKWASSSPPTIGPIATPMPTAVAQMPMALARSRGSNTLEMMDSVCGMTAAAPRPMAARAKISISGLREYAVSRENRPKAAMPNISIFLRPIRSPITPKVNSRPAKTSV